jgi:hypothetical protein
MRSESEGACPDALHPETPPNPDGYRRLGLSPHAKRGEGEGA